MSTAPTASSHWRNPVFLLVFVPFMLVWLTFLGWLVWLTFHPVTDWIGRQHALLQELLGFIYVAVGAILFGLGVGAAAHFAERIANIRPPFVPTPTPANGAVPRWHHGRRREADSPTDTLN